MAYFERLTLSGFAGWTVAAGWSLVLLLSVAAFGQNRPPNREGRPPNRKDDHREDHREDREDRATLPEEKWYQDLKRVLAAHYTGMPVRTRVMIPATRRGVQVIDGVYQAPRAAEPR